MDIPMTMVTMFFIDIFTNHGGSVEEEEEEEKEEE